MDSIKKFEDRPIRTSWDEEKEEWYFSVSDVVEALSESKDVKQYIKKMRSRDPEFSSKWGTICTPVRMMTADGKYRKINAADTKGILRIIQSIPSKKAEPFKMWLAQVGSERIEEIIDPELTIERALETYAKKGYPADWINQRLQTIRARKELTDQWQAHGVEKGQEYAILTDEVTKAWSGMTTRQYKNLKGLKKENLRDNMSTLELALNMLAEATTTELTKTQNPFGLEENREVANSGGKIAGDARKSIEAQTGKPVITYANAAKLNEVVTGMIESVIRDDEKSE
ncbi:MAG: hypothetical protein IJR57_08140 [Ruminococcus sp.]|nr:hypothetical protein [Ruminococcus sp.]